MSTQSFSPVCGFGTKHAPTGCPLLIALSMLPLSSESHSVCVNER